MDLNEAIELRLRIIIPIPGQAHLLEQENLGVATFTWKVHFYRSEREASHAVHGIRHKIEFKEKSVSYCYRGV